MKINLNKKELEKTYRLLDTKEINKSVADLLFYAYGLKDAFGDPDKYGDYYEQLLSNCGVSEEDYEERDLLEKWIKPAISPLNRDFFEKNLYFKTVKPKPFIDDGFALEYLTFEAYQPFSLNDIEVDENDYFLERSPISYCVRDERYLALSYKGVVWMSITPNEINTMQPYIDQVEGDVLVLGLGLGYYPFMISQKKNVKSITIIEGSKRVINIFKQHILPFFPHKDKIKIIWDDAFAYLKKNKAHYDYVFADLWHNAEDGLPLYLELKEYEKKMSSTKFQYWLEKSLIAMLRRCLLTVYEEALQNYPEKAYLEAKNPIDQIVNDLYFKTKNITISSYDDIYNLLKDESILKLI